MLKRFSLSRVLITSWKR